MMTGGRSVAGHRVLAAVLVCTGFSSVGLQVLWQRMVAMQVGADALSSAIVVAGFLSGLAIGSFVAARLADRVEAVNMVRCFAGAEVVVAVMAAASTWMLYDVFTSVTARLGTVAIAAVAVVMVMVPATLMGFSIPASAAFVGRDDSAGTSTSVGVLYAANSIGAALGAVVTGWFLIGELGIRGTSFVCAAVGLGAAAALAALSRSDAPSPAAVATRSRERPDGSGWVAGGSADDRARPWPWYVAYGIAGMLTLGLQQAFFRFTGSIQRANSYSFATVLAMYLGSFAAGVAVGSVAVRRVEDPRRWFLWLQFAVGVAALASLTFVVRVLPHLGFASRAEAWFSSDGLASGFSSGASGLDVVTFAVVLPMVVIVPAVALMGASFPFIERIVLERRATSGGGTGRLLAANTLGNVVGTFAAATILFEVLGAAGTIVALSGLLLIAGVAATALDISAAARTRAPVGALVALVVGGSLLLAAPGNLHLWEFLSGDTGRSAVLLSEDGACAAVVRRHDGGDAELLLNGASQNAYPFDDFHVLIGLLPTLATGEPGGGLVIGHGIGSTAYAMLADTSRRSVTTVELCGGVYPLSDELADEGVEEFVVLRDDPRHERVTSDGRRYLERSETRYDAIVVDTLRVTSAGSGQHFSTEFYRLVDDHLTDQGVFVQWVPTWRTQNSAAQVFPYLVTAEVAQYGGSILMLGSRSPIDVDRFSDRFDERAAAAFEPMQRSRLEDFLADLEPDCVTDGRVAESVPSELENSDLFPRDEYHQNNGFIDRSQAVTTC